MKTKFLLMCLFAALALPTFGCDKKDKAEKGDEEAKAEEAKREESGDEEGAAKKEEKEEDAGEVELATFTKELPKVGCKTLGECKNEKIQQTFSGLMMMTAGFAGMQNPEVGKKLKKVQETLKKDERSSFNEAECNTVAGVMIEVSGLQQDVLAKKVGKTVEYDPKKGAACLQELAKMSACDEEVKAEGKLKMQEMQATLQKLEKQGPLKACEETLAGKLEEGKECEFGYECQGEMKCSDGKDAKKKTCQSRKKPGAPSKGAKDSDESSK